MIERARLTTIAGVLALALVGGPVGSADEAASGFDLQRQLEEKFRYLPGGATALIVRVGVTTSAAAGDADAGGTPMTVGTPLWIGSITKTFVAAMVLQLVEEGAIELEAPPSTYLLGTHVGGDVLIADLLAQRSGLGDFPQPFEAIPEEFAQDIVKACVAGRS